MNLSKKLLLAGSVFTVCVLAPTAKADPYDDYMKRIMKDMSQMGLYVDAFNANPFQTGTALDGYYLSEKTLLLERDAFFSMKANKLKSTDAVAEYHHRTKILQSHANNMLLQLMQSVDQRNKEGFYAVEKPAIEKSLDEIIKSCEKDAACVADRLAHPETSMTNILVDNFGLATEVFKQVPHMHVLEVNSVYQLIQLEYLEVFYSQNKVSSVEFELFLDKQTALRKNLERSRNLTPSEKNLQVNLVTNMVRKWKARILERKFKHGDEYSALTAQLKKQNQSLVLELDKLRVDNPSVLSELRRDEDCYSLRHWREHKWCQARKHLRETYTSARKGENILAELKKVDLPKDFWKEF